MKVSRALIAIVDDEESVRKALQRLLLSAGFSVATFASGAEFMSWLDRRRPACVVLDLHMPGISGFEVQAQLTRANDKLPVVFITGNHTEESKQRVTSGGASAYLLKPVDDELLISALTVAIGNNTETNEA